MFDPKVRAVLAREDLSAATKVIWLTIVDHADSGDVHLSRGDLSTLTAVSPSTVTSAMAQLVEHGMVTVVRTQSVKVLG